MTIKDIRRLRKIKGVTFAISTDAPELKHYINFRSYREMIKYVKNNYTANLKGKKANKTLTGVMIWRKEEGRK